MKEKELSMNTIYRLFLLSLVFLSLTISGEKFVCTADVPSDVRPDYHNKSVTTLSEDCESVRMALGVCWENALLCRTMSGYINPWSSNDFCENAESIIKQGTRLYELMKCVDEGILGVRFARDTRDAPHLEEEISFWRNELALAASKIMVYSNDVKVLKAKMQNQLENLAQQKGISTETIPQMPWKNVEREAWRKAGVRTGVRLSLEPPDAHPVHLWNRNLSFDSLYMVQKLRMAGETFFSTERPLGAWGLNCTGKGQYDFSRLINMLRALKERNCQFLLELPTLNSNLLSPEKREGKESLVRSDNWIWALYAPSLPDYLVSDESASLIARDKTGKLVPNGMVQLFNPSIAEAYGEYLKAMAEELRRNNVYYDVAAIHLEMGDSANLSEDVDYSTFARKRWQDFLKQRYGDIGKLNYAAKTQYRAWDDVEIPVKIPVPSIQTKSNSTLEKKDETTVEFEYPDIIKTDYLHFRRTYVRDYLDIKRSLVEAAFPDKLVIAEMRQLGDHDGIGGKEEKIWGGFLGQSDDIAQFSNVGPCNDDLPFMIRSVGPVGFGSRLSDAVESLYRDYLWINFLNPGNLARYFYVWTSQGYMDYQLGWHAILNHWLTNQMVYHLGPTVANTAPEPQRIGLVLPRATFDLYREPTSQRPIEWGIYYEYLGWDWLLGSSKLTYTRVDESLIRQGWLERSGLQVLILPNTSAMDEQVASAIERWVSKGGTLICSNMPGKTDNYGRVLGKSPLQSVLGASVSGHICEPISNSPLTVTIPRGVHSGGWLMSTDRTPSFEVLNIETARVLNIYESGVPAITLNRYGKGQAVLMGYPFGEEAVIADRCGVGFYRTYTRFAQEPQLVARTAWLKEFICDILGFHPEFSVDYADVERFKGNEASSLGLGIPKGFSQADGDFFYVRTVGDPRGETHEIETEHENPDMALRFFPRQRAGIQTHYLGISTREVHYIAPRGAVNMYLSRHTYRCRINNPKIQAIWDVGQNLPVGFEKDDTGITFTVSLPSGYLMMLAYSETPKIELFEPMPFPGRTKDDVLARCETLSGGTEPEPVTVFYPNEIKAWLQSYNQPLPDNNELFEMIISYGDSKNKPAAETLATFLRNHFHLNTSTVEQSSVCVLENLVRANLRLTDYEKPVIFIGTDWSNNDIALQSAYWAWPVLYGPHLPFTATYEWPGKGRALVALSREYALVNDRGRPITPNDSYNSQYEIRKVKHQWPLVRRKLYIAADGENAQKAVDYLITLIQELKN